MRTVGAVTAVIGVAAAATLVATGPTGAATGTGVYADWTIDGSATTASFTGTYFPDISGTRVDGSWQVASGASTWLGPTTPFGAEYGSSRDRSYLYTALPLNGTSTAVTLTFSTPPVEGTWGFALGDIDAEDITISATGPGGSVLDVSGWFESSFNYCDVSPKPSSCPAGTHTDEPRWTSPVLRGSTSDTNGAAAWFRPTAEVSTLTFQQERNVAGAPIYQLWIAADVLDEPPAAAAVCTRDVTALVNGGFEVPVIPVKSFRQLPESDVPGWRTTATDSKIELWSTGFQGVAAPEGDQFAELNATQPSELYQVVDTVPGQTLTWSLLHRARAKGAVGDTMSVNIGADAAAPDAVYTFTDVLDAGWVRHTGEYLVPDGQTRTRFGFESGPTASGSRSIGNFLDDIYFTTEECLPAAVTEADAVVSSASPAPSASPSPSIGDSGSPSPSASPTPTPTDTAASASASPSPSTSPSGTVSPSATPSDTSIPSPSATVAESGSPSPETTASPSPTRTETPVPVIVTPDRPTPIDVISDSGTDPDSTVTSVDEPRHGTAEIKDNTVIYTPDPGFIGRDIITAYVKEPTGEITVIRAVVETGREQIPVKSLGLPRSVAPNRTVVLIDHPVVTNAGQQARVRAQCIPLTRIQAAGGFSGCIVTRDGSTVMVTVTGVTPYRVRVTVTAPAKGDYRPYAYSRTYTVRP